ncbi:ArsR/SmtB family transcription factor [Corynebacterium cystitidis]|uniref:ArsR/SmtB family transcription factor n=1 Tax=Corynebacterium cystitidis TaxID=35757 RepID=UPI00211F2265|nr:winged helix-turn-helix domain-containing protein [Corynebacterium cystitidis]
MDTGNSRDALSLEKRISALEKRVNALEGHGGVRGEGLDGLQTCGDADGTATGSVRFGGEVQVGGRELTYEWSRAADYLSGPAWDSSLQRVAALASPIRAQVLRRLLERPATVAELVDEGLFTSTGKAYHHLNELLHAGWLVKDGRGQHSIPPARVIPLLSIVAAGEDH